jgi:hypothetical protein
VSAFTHQPEASQQRTTSTPANLAQGDVGQRTERQSILMLQRTVGNQAVQRLLRRQTAARLQPPIELVQTDPATDTAQPGASGAGGAPSELMTRAAVAMGSGPAKYNYVVGDVDAKSLYVIFDNPDVQAFFRYLLKDWFGVAGISASLEDTPSTSAPPSWVEAFRTKALNIEPHPSGEGKQLREVALGLANSVAAETPAQRLRRQFVEEADKRIGSTVMTQAQIDAERAKPASGGMTPANFTTCIAFFGQVVGQVTKQSKLKGSLLDGPNAYKEINPQATQKLPDGAWHPCTAGAADRPEPGDLLIFTFLADVLDDQGKLKYGKGYFAHITIFRSAQPLGDTDEDKKANGLGKEFPGTTLEKWTSIDGGGTTASETVRYFCSDKCVIAGRSDKRTLHGWIDIEKVAEAQLAKSA